MSGNVTIGGVDVYATYGAYIKKGGHKELFQWPSLKSVRGNDWQEYDGFEPDLSNPRLDTREFIITFAVMGGKSNVRSFYNFLLTEPKMSYTFSGIGRTLSLRVVSMPDLKYCEAFNIVTVRFACDEPLSSAQSPSSSLAENRNYVIDGTPLSAYGVRTLKGTVAATMKRPDVKPLLTRNNSVIDGAEYDENPIINDPGGSLPSSAYWSVGNTVDGVPGTWKQRKAGGSVTTRARDITLDCLLTAPSLSNAWRNYDALLYDITKKNNSASDDTLAGAHEILIRPIGGEYRFYYKSQQVLDYYIGMDGEVWIEFNLTLTLFEAISESGDDSGGGGGTQLFFLLSSEDGGFVITEDGKLIPLDLD